MKLKDYLRALKELEKQHRNKEVFFSIDDEGNDFQPVTNTPSVMDIEGQMVVVIN